MHKGGSEYFNQRQDFNLEPYFLYQEGVFPKDLRGRAPRLGKKIPGAPHEVMLILDATTGQNAISQAKLFNATVDITGLTLTKLDGTAKCGIVVNICRELKIPIRFIGIGEQLADLRDFDPDEFVEALFQEQESR